MALEIQNFRHIWYHTWLLGAKFMAKYFTSCWPYDENQMFFEWDRKIWRDYHIYVATRAVRACTFVDVPVDKVHASPVRQQQQMKANGSGAANSSETLLEPR